MKIIEDVKLDFDDVLIKPKRSQAKSRSAVEINRNFKFLYSGREWTGFPLIISNMDTVGTITMANRVSTRNALVCLHKYYSPEKLIEHLSTNKQNVFYTLGITDEDYNKLKSFPYELLDFVCIDAANGNTQYFVDRVRQIRDLLPNVTIMAGNVCTPEMVQELIINGKADIIKIGIGPGSGCSTRRVTGIGYPQLSAIIECSDVAHGLKAHICADGGCRNSGHIVKAFGACADFVMIGGMAAGTEECEAEWEIIHDIKTNKYRRFMKFYGMSSELANKRYNGGMNNYKAAEGVETLVEFKGSILDVLQEIEGGIRSACTYVGASRLKDLGVCTTFIRVNRIHDKNV